MLASRTLLHQAKALMDLALATKDLVEYTGQPTKVYAMRTECYKLRNAARLLDDTRYDTLTFGTEQLESGQLTLVIARTDA